MDNADCLKTEENEFYKILENCPIFCFQETKGNISLPNFKCDNKLRKGSRSGGLCIGVQRTFSENFKSLDTECDDIQAVQITLNSGPDTDNETLTIINVYDSSEYSAYKANRKQSNQCSTLELLLDFIAKNNIDKILLLGDFHARTKYLNLKGMSEDSIDDNYLKKQKCGFVNHFRASKDGVVNTRGRLFLDFLASTNLSLLNGCVIGDIMGEFTSVNYNGSSVVDYIAVSHSLRNYVINFNVGNLTKFSDHKPLFCSLKIKSQLISGDTLLESFVKAPVRYNVSESHRPYQEAQDSTEIQQELQECLETDCKDQEDVLRLNTKLTSTERMLTQHAPGESLQREVLEDS